MENTDEQWERRFRRRFDDFESEPSPDALDRILAGVGTPLSLPWWKRYFYPALGGLALLGLLSLDWMLDNPKTMRQIIGQRLTKAAGRTNENALVPGAGLAGVNAKDNKETTALDRPSVAETELSQRVPAKNREMVWADHRSKKGRQTSPFASFDRPSTVPASRMPVSRRHSATALSTTSGNAVRQAENRLRKPYGGLTEFREPVSPEQQKAWQSEMVLTGLPSRPFRLHTQATLPTVAHSSARPLIEPPIRLAGLSFYAQVTPLYTFRTVRPVLSDDVVVQDFRSAASLSARTGWRIKLGVEKPLTRRFNLRAALAWQQLQQEIEYGIRANSPDTVKVEKIDDQTVRITPVYQTTLQQSSARWHYLIGSLEGRLTLNEGKIRQYVVAGGSAGYIINRTSDHRWQPFLHLGFGLERRIGHNMLLQIEPGLIYNLTPSLDARRHFYVRPYSYGLTVGLQWTD